MLLDGRISRREFIALSLASITTAYVLPGILTSYTVEINKLDLGLGKRLALLTDLHIHQPRYDLRALLEAVKPDIVVLAGDTWDEDTPRLDVVEETLKSIKPLVKAGIAVLGNHEHWSGWKHSIKEGIHLLEDNGFTVLRDSLADIAGFRIAGLDWRENPRQYPGVIARDADIIIAHSPDALPSLPGHEALFLAGHTHGGQVCLPGARSIVTNSVYGYKWGLYRVDRIVAYISRGLGEKFPVRIYCPRQLVIIV